MQTAIISGANGFIGKAVCKKLISKNINVFALVRNKDSMADISSNNLHIVEVELKNYDNLINLLPKNIDVFFHFAWEGAYGKCLSNYEQQIKNIKYTCDAIYNAKRINCKKFILAGTINELELMQFFSCEENNPRPSCIYGAAKLSCDLMCKTIAAEISINYNTAIIGSCFGPGDKSRRIHNVFITNMIEGTRPKLVEGNNLHDWIYIDDVADMFYAIGKKSLNMKNYYIGHRQLRLFKDILCEVRDILNPNLEIKFGEIKSKFFIDYSLIDINSVYEDTNYECKSNFKECIIKTAEWLKTQYI